MIHMQTSSFLVVYQEVPFTLRAGPKIGECYTYLPTFLPPTFLNQGKGARARDKTFVFIRVHSWFQIQVRSQKAGHARSFPSGLHGFGDSTRGQ
jgi:hypothetical protein